MPITPKDIADNAVMEWVTTGYGWFVTAAIIIAGLIWRTSKEHSRYEAVLVAIEKMQKAQETCITQDAHDLMQLRCQEHLMHVVAEKFRAYEKVNQAEVTALRIEISDLNANICKLMGAMNIEPISSGKRRKGDS